MATSAYLALHDKVFQPGAEALKLIGCKLAPVGVRWNIKRKVQIPSPARADLRREMHGQRASNRIAGRDLGRIEMNDPTVNLQTLPLGPFGRAGVAGDEEGTH